MPTDIKNQAQTNIDQENKPETHLTTAIKSLFVDILALLGNHIELATLEAKLLLGRLLSIMIASICLAFLVLTIWVGLSAVGVIYLMDSGFTLANALLSLVVLNILVACVVRIVILIKIKNLKFGATLRTLSTDEAPAKSKKRSRSK